MSMTLFFIGAGIVMSACCWYGRQPRVFMSLLLMLSLVVTVTTFFDLFVHDAAAPIWRAVNNQLTNFVIGFVGPYVILAVSRGGAPEPIK